MATQQRLDAAHAAALENFEHAVAPLLTHLDASLVAPLAPPRQRLTDMSLHSAVDLTVERSVGFSLSVEPLGVGVARRFDTSTAHTSRVTVSVEAVPFFSHLPRRTP